MKGLPAGLCRGARCFFQPVQEVVAQEGVICAGDAVPFLRSYLRQTGQKLGTKDRRMG